MSGPETSERELEERLAGWRAPGEAEAEERSRRVAVADFTERSPRRRRVPRRTAVVAVLAGAVAGLALTPAGAKVSDLVSSAVDDDSPTPTVKLGGLPHVGPLLVSSEAGMWIVEPDGSRRELGDYDDAVFSPHGLFVAASTDRELVALSPDGDREWTIEGDDWIHDPAWSASGFRIAYLDGDVLHVVAGDGTTDHELASEVFFPPVWRPPDPAALRSSVDGTGTHQLTYVDVDGRVRLIDTDTGRKVWSSDALIETDNPPATIEDLSWSTDGSRLLIETSRGYAVLRRDGSLVAFVSGSRLGDVAISADGSKVALSAPRGRARTVLVESSRAGGQPVATVFSGPGPITDLDWSAHGRTLAIGWKNAGEWVFIQPGGHATGVSDVAEQFGGTGRAFPRIEDWCCEAPGSG